ncbi:MAG: ATP-dependent 6-phosphofructokinase [Methylococcales bacterium]|jgi:6-phosphofructokinase 1|nr:ATP-dependent 6-phosphofructokinase [Methylococcales bacterium]
MAKHIGILTAGGDCPGLNAAIRGVGKSAQYIYNMDLIGFQQGFKGLVENRFIRLDGEALSGILTLGGTILGTSRDKPHKMNVAGNTLDMTDSIVENYQNHHLDALVCLGGGGTQKNAMKLQQRGLNVITLPKTIDNDVAKTDISFGFDTALGIATDAIDRLHSTAHSHHRIIVTEIMGHKAGWLALGAGIAGGADVILIPEIPYDINIIAEAITKRSRDGKQFSIVAVAEGAISTDGFEKIVEAEERKKQAESKEDKKKISQEIKTLEKRYQGNTLEIAHQLEELTRLESRVTILGHIQRGGTPSAADRLLATRLGTACASYIQEEQYGIMVSAKGNLTVPVPLEEVAGHLKLVPREHSWVTSAIHVGTCLGSKDLQSY